MVPFNVKRTLFQVNYRNRDTRVLTLYESCFVVFIVDYDQMLTL